METGLLQLKHAPRGFYPLPKKRAHSASHACDLQLVSLDQVSAEDFQAVSKVSFQVPVRSNGHL